ncbi:hypothetical protein FXO38_14455 [Capsicum annuum]|uniref:FBD domain-containing protein n=1 Tax=Capsicum annuum TaxID=4072 RepID=A0A2G2YQX1_CAPAN|nr:hypothetical protein FXO38_14455 [Capsicum annuum]KAF3685927.1 hypothetical protein FXO37_00134 [Capsicum annuum]PHT72146.1 hypothetical protein T459_22931 [Capsicum annuum]
MASNILFIDFQSGVHHKNCLLHYSHVSQLGHLTLNTTSISLQKISGVSSNIIEISAPLLRSIDYIGNVRSVCLENIPLLKELSLSHREYYLGARKCNIAKFFESFFVLDHLHFNDMEQVKYQCGFPMIFIVSNISAYRVYICLTWMREVKLMQTNGTIPERQLIKLLLAKSPKLVRMLIELYLVEQSATVEIVAELIKFQRAPPNAEVVYNLYKYPNPHPV